MFGRAKEISFDYVRSASKQNKAGADTRFRSADTDFGGADTDSGGAAEIAQAEFFLGFDSILFSVNLCSLFIPTENRSHLFEIRFSLRRLAPTASGLDAIYNYMF